MSGISLPGFAKLRTAVAGPFRCPFRPIDKTFGPFDCLDIVDIVSQTSASSGALLFLYSSSFREGI
jgi:hypothetical protein